VIGPADHGVVRFAHRLAQSANGPVLHLAQAGQADHALLAAHLDPAVRAVHLQYTDALYAPHTTDAATTFLDLRRRIAARDSDRGPAREPLTVSVTMHDLPDPDDEPGRYRRRALSYARVAGAVDTVVVSSDHELALLQLLPVLPVPARLDRPPNSGPRMRVIPLPLEAPRIVARPDRPVPRPEVAVFGFIYPGKGHEDVLQAMVGLPPEVRFTALGRPADGHEPMRSALAALAHRSQRRMEITGFVADRELDERMQRIAVPIVPARKISASGSLNSWIAAGRRPLVADGPYPREFAGRYPGAIELYRPDELPALIRTGLAEPETSWLVASPPPELTAPAVAAAYRALLTEVSTAGGRRTEAGEVLA
jgi:glycosyltransferase involved in cell wall biosynthesis